MPTPRATDGTKGGPNQRGSSGDLMLPSAVTDLLPTPAVNDMGEGKTPKAWDEWTAEMKAKHGNGNDHGNSLSIEAQRVANLPTPTAKDAAASGGAVGSPNVTLTDATVRYPERWGKYAAAIARAEQAFGRSAPAPTQLSSKGTPQLSPLFSEWLMGLPEGHITDPAIWDGMTDKKGRPASAAAKRNAQLKAAGNGVVPRQCAVAIRICLRRAMEVAA
jgi:DNA (cytosine-5)-methyltransferase 1